MDRIIEETLYPSEEIKAGKAELLCGNWLKDIIKAFKSCAEEQDVELPGGYATSTFLCYFLTFSSRFQYTELVHCHH